MGNTKITTILDLSEEKTLSHIQDNLYKNSYNKYKKILEENETKTEMEKTQLDLIEVPKETSQQIQDYTSSVLSCIPDDIWQETPPTTRSMTYGLFMAALHTFEKNGPTLNNDFSTIIGCSLSNNTANLGSMHNLNKTPKNAIENYLQNNSTNVTKEAFGNMLKQILVSSNPIFNPFATINDSNLEEQRNLILAEYKKYETALKNEITETWQALERLRQEYSPSTRFDQTPKFPTFVIEIEDTKDQSSHPEGFVQSIDPVTQKHYSIVSIGKPFNENLKSAPNSENRLYRYAHNAVHEMIHEQNATPIIFEKDIYQIINELLTDHLTEIAQLKRYNIDLTKATQNQVVHSGYSNLIAFSRSLIKKGLIEISHIVHYGITQDSNGFTDLLATLCHDQSQREQLLITLKQRNIILPITERESKEILKQLEESPKEILVKLLTEGIERFGTELPHYLFKLYDYIKDNNKTLFEKLEKQNRYPGNELMMLKNEDGYWPDEVVYMYRKMIAEENR